MAMAAAGMRAATRADPAAVGSLLLLLCRRAGPSRPGQAGWAAALAAAAAAMAGTRRTRPQW
eukprot:7389571-Prymnesium_polylepis.2